MTRLHARRTPTGFIRLFGLPDEGAPAPAKAGTTYQAVVVRAKGEPLTRRQLWGGRFSEPPARGPPGASTTRSPFDRALLAEDVRGLDRLGGGARHGAASSRRARSTKLVAGARGDRRRGVPDGRAARRGRRGRPLVRRGAPRGEGRAARREAPHGPLAERPGRDGLPALPEGRPRRGRGGRARPRARARARARKPRPRRRCRATRT